MSLTLLDTHVWVWWLDDPSRLSASALSHVESVLETDRLHVSSISVWEVAMLVAGGRLELTLDLNDWLVRAESLPFFTFVPVDNHVALRSTQLADPLPADPADRMIVATAESIGAKLVTSDRRMRACLDDQAVW